ncbi:MAG: OmpH family outer membrane protein [Erythrobacter sp.]|uniref:OmpH family outer membrane protein n=1 Tax=Parasphingorhabdus sp. TaxID=2709688 RepID=UPI00329A4737
MKNLIKPLMAASIAAAAIAAPLATPAAAQVNGIATSNPTAVILRSAARVAGYNAIQTTYAAQIQQINQLNAELNTLQRSLDTNGDQQLTDAEVQANPTAVQQIQAKELEVQTASQPIALAQYYVIEQLLNDYGNARNQVIQNKSISLMISPDALQYAPEGIDVTSDIIAAVDARLPTVATAVPAGWQPRRETAQMHQAVQQVLVVAAQQAAARQAQQPAAAPAAAPSGR